MTVWASSPTTWVSYTAEGSAILPVDVHLYGKLRRFARNRRTTAGSIVNLDHRAGDTIGLILARMGIALEDTSNIFLNGELSAPTRLVSDGDRLGIFPDDMALLYRWYFAKQG